MSFHDYAFIYPEMMVHPAFFLYGRPQQVLIMTTEERGILQEALKHPSIMEVWHPSTQIDDARVKFHSNEMKTIKPDYFDIVLLDVPVTSELLRECFRVLHANGLLIQMSHSPFQLDALKIDQQQLAQIGFKDFQSLQFPARDGWRTAWLAAKKHLTRHVSEKAIFNRSFQTKYYNFDTHRAAFALPEFMRHELEETLA